jgi:hypothetical protein
MLGGAHLRIPGAAASRWVYDGPVTGPTPQEPARDEAAAASRGRSTAIGAGAFLLLAVPFLVFSFIMLNLKARVELQCDPGGPCLLLQRSWIGQEEVGMFILPELQEATVERTRSDKRDAAVLYKPMLVTTRGTFPLSTQWLTDEAQARSTVRVVNGFRANPFLSRKGFLLFHDHRRGPLIVGALSDALMPELGEESLRYALSVLVVTPLFAAGALWLAYRRARVSTAPGIPSEAAVTG